MFKTVTSDEMTHGPLFKKMILYTLPIILSGVLQLLFNAADLIVVGKFSGNLALAAVGATGSLTNLIVCLFIGLSVGTSVLVAQRLGAENPEGVSRVVHTSVAAALTCGVAVSVLGFTCSHTFLVWMDTPEDVIDLSTVYMKIYFTCMPACMLYNYGSAVLRSAGDTRRPLMILFAAGVLNVILNLIFVLCFGMSVDGVSLATSISQYFSAALVILCLLREKSTIHLDLRKVRFHWTELKLMMRIGIPAGLQSGAFSLSNVLIQSKVNDFGSTFMSGNSAASSLEGFIYIAMNAFHHTALTFTGQNYGAGRTDRVNRILGICVASTAATGIAIGAFVFALRHPLLRIYLPDNEEAIADGIQRMRVISTTYFTCGIMDAISGTLRGLGSSVPPVVITLTSVCVLRIVWLYTVFEAIGTPFSLYAGYPVSWVLCILAQLLYYFRLKRRIVTGMSVSL